VTLTWQDYGPTGLVLALLAVAAAVGLLAAPRRGAALPTLLVFAVAIAIAGTEAGRFDGHAHLTEKMDATLFVWARAVVMRGLGGVVALLLAAPIGVAASRWVTGPDEGDDTPRPAPPTPRRAALAGLAVIGPFASGLWGSSLALQHALVALKSLDAQVGEPARLVILAAGIDASDAALLAGGVLGGIGALAVAAALLLPTGRGA
jgi:hypothetical protein